MKNSDEQIRIQQRLLEKINNVNTVNYETINKITGHFKTVITLRSITGGSVRLKLITLEKYQVLYRNYFGLW